MLVYHYGESKVMKKRPQWETENCCLQTILQGSAYQGSAEKVCSQVENKQGDK